MKASTIINHVATATIVVEVILLLIGVILGIKILLG